MDEMDVYDPLGFILEITPYGYIAKGWRTYKNKDLNNFWIEYQKLEKSTSGMQKCRIIWRLLSCCPGAILPDRK